MAAKIKKGDTVIVLTGRDKGKKGEVLEVRPARNRLVVKGVNLVKRHRRATQTEEGGIFTKEATIHASNVAFVDPKQDKPTRVGFKIDENGTKSRFAKRSGGMIDG